MQKEYKQIANFDTRKFQAEYPHIFKRNFGEIALNRVHFCKAECLRQQSQEHLRFQEKQS